MSADTATGGGVIVNYQSDFLTFPNGEHNFSLTFSSWTTALQQGVTAGLTVLAQVRACFSCRLRPLAQAPSAETLWRFLSRARWSSPDWG